MWDTQLRRFVTFINVKGNVLWKAKLDFYYSRASHKETDLGVWFDQK